MKWAKNIRSNAKKNRLKIQKHIFKKEIISEIKYTAHLGGTDRIFYTENILEKLRSISTEYPEKIFIIDLISNLVYMGYNHELTKDDEDNEILIVNWRE